MASFIVEGGTPLSGEITPSGNKNEALPVLAACLLSHQPTVLENVPRIGDIHTMIQILQGLGVKIQSTTDGQLKLDSSNINADEPNQLQHEVINR